METPNTTGDVSLKNAATTHPGDAAVHGAQEDGSEVTQLESDSENDIFSADATASNVKVEDTARTQEEALSKEQLCLRRLDHIKELQELYKAELWAVLEELHARHHHFQSAGGATGGPGFQPLQALLGKRKQPESAAASPAEEEADVQKSSEDLDMVTIEPATTVCAPAAPNAQEGAGSRDAAGKCAAAGLACAEGNGRIPGEGANAADLPSFSEAEDFILEGNGQAPDALRLGCLRQLTRARLGRIARLEQAASGSTARQLGKAGALAVLTGRQARFLIKRSAFTIGRPTASHGAVDVDLGREGDASQVSRHQARVALRPDGAFAITNTGRRKLHINGCQVERGQSALMQHLSLLEVGGIRLLLHIDHSAVRRLLGRSATFGDFPGA